jgi:isopentenyl-diphosphate delta-isomerase
MSDIYKRKLDHIELCTNGDVENGVHRGLFEEVHLLHDALPELAMDELDLQAKFLDHQLSAPLMITGMTGGPAEAGEINRGLAILCADMGIAFGVGSQRIVARAPESTDTFRVRAVAPNVVLVGNIGVMQAKALGAARVLELVMAIEADYLAVHLNPAMELVQPGTDADRDFRGGYDTIGHLVDALGGRVLVKECGTGLSPKVVRRLMGLGVRAVDVSGVGGTSWIKVEALRNEGMHGRLGKTFAAWGLPTAAATAMARSVAPDATIVASGGIDNGLTAARALALGASVAGLARPVLQAWQREGAAGAYGFLSEVLAGLRMAMMLTGSRSTRRAAGRCRACYGPASNLQQAGSRSRRSDANESKGLQSPP